MANLKQVEFAKLCGIPKSSIPIYIKRNKIIIKDGLIDEENPVNKAFKLKTQEKQKLKKSNKTEKETQDIGDKKEKNTILKPNKKNNHKGSDYHELEKIKKELDIEKLQEEIQILEKRNMKLDGESIPTEIAKTLFAGYGKEITVAFHNFSENWLTKISKIKGLSNGELAEMRGELANGVNEGVMVAQNRLKKSLTNIIKEYSLKREVGEHD